MNKPILYLCQAYSKYPQPQYKDCLGHEAYELATDYVRMLWDLGFEAFSPIMYTHPFHAVFNYPTNIDYVAHDLKIIEGFMKHDGGQDLTSCCHQKWAKKNEEICICIECGTYYDIQKELIYHQFDSGVVCVFAEDCFHYKSSTYTYIKEDPLIWDSNGAKAKYDFAHAHHIKCVRLSELREIYNEAKDRYSLKQPTGREDLLLKIIEECEPL